MAIFVPMFDPDRVDVSKGIGFLHQCATPLGSMRREVEIFAPMCDPVGVGVSLDKESGTDARPQRGRTFIE